MNRAATIVLAVLAYVVLAYTTASIAYPFFGKTLSDSSNQAYNLALGALIGVIGKTGFDALKEQMQSGDRGEQQK